MNRTTKTMGAIAAVALLGGLAANAAVVFEDTFNTGLPAGQGVWNDLNAASTGYPTRQAGGITNSTYTLGLESGQTLIGPAADTAGLPEPVLLRVNTTDDGAGNILGGRVYMDLDTDFGSHLAGKEWTLKYSSKVAASVGYSGWTGFAVGNPANTPIDAGTALGVNIFAAGAVQVWTNGVLASSGGLGIGNSVAGLVYDLTITFDEAAGTARITYEDANAKVVDLGTYAVAFLDGSRFVELKNLVGDGAGGVGIVDWRVDNLRIEAFPSPVSATLGFIGLGGGGNQ